MGSLNRTAEPTLLRNPEKRSFACQGVVVLDTGENNIILSSLFIKCVRYRKPEQTDKVALASYNTSTEPRHSSYTASTNKYTSPVMNGNSLCEGSCFFYIIVRSH